MKARNEFVKQLFAQDSSISDEALTAAVLKAGFPWGPKHLEYAQRWRANGDTSAGISVSAVPDTEPWDEKIARITEAFAIYDGIARQIACKEPGAPQGLVVYGPPGIGKSWTLETTLTDALVVKGAASAVGLFEVLFQGREQTVVFDDCDSALQDIDGLNVLKAVLDTTGSRTVRWARQNKQLKEATGLDELEFKFKGRVVFCTNTDFYATGNTKASRNLRAVLDRCDYLDLGIRTKEDLLARMEIVIGPGETMDFIKEHVGKWNSLSIRLAVRINELRESGSPNWQAMALALRGRQ